MEELPGSDPMICTVPGCTTDCHKKKTRMYIIPKQIINHHFCNTASKNVKDRRQSWLANIGCIEPIAEKAHICQHHFISGNTYYNFYINL